MPRHLWNPVRVYAKDERVLLREAKRARPSAVIYFAHWCFETLTIFGVVQSKLQTIVYSCYWTCNLSQQKRSQLHDTDRVLDSLKLGTIWREPSTRWKSRWTSKFLYHSAKSTSSRQIKRRLVTPCGSYSRVQWTHDIKVWFNKVETLGPNRNCFLKQL